MRRRQAARPRTADGFWAQRQIAGVSSGVSASLRPGKTAERDHVLAGRSLAAAVLDGVRASAGSERARSSRRSIGRVCWPIRCSRAMFSCSCTASICLPICHRDPIAYRSVCIPAKPANACRSRRTRCVAITCCCSRSPANQRAEVFHGGGGARRTCWMALISVSRRSCVLGKIACACRARVVCSSGVRLLTAQHNHRYDRCAGFLLQGGENLKAVELRHSQIEQDHIGLIAQRARHDVLRFCDPEDFIIGQRQNRL